MVDKKNGGYGSVLELAISKIDSEFFMICDPDDWLTSDAVEVLLDNALRNKSDIVIGNRYDVYNTENQEPQMVDVTCNDIYVDKKNVYVGEDCCKAAFCDVSPHSKLYRTSICKDITFEKNVSYTDTTLFLVALIYIY